ncbi:MAG: transposase, partial [Wolbachia sp.]
MFPEFTLFSSLFYRFLIRNWGFEKLFDRGLKLVTKVKKGMKNTLMLLEEKIFLRKRS